MKPKYDITSTESFAQWDITPTVKKHLEAARLDSIYCFSIRDTCYKAELTAMWYPQQRMPVWGLAVRHSEWATHLAELERLPVGRQASWGDTMSTFFPDDGQSASCADDGAEALTGNGLSILTDKLLKLSDIVSSVTAAGGVQL
jgi:nicotinamidase-related amidase